MKKFIAFFLAVLILLPFNVPIIANENSENILLNMPVSTSVADSFYTQNYPASRLTDGQNTDSSNASIINFLSTGLGWYEIDLLQSKTINQAKIVFQNAEWNYRPKDYVVDIYYDGAWIRVVEQHNVNYTQSLYVFNFAPVLCEKIRITGSNARNISLNFRLVELEAYNDSTITANDYTPLQQVDDVIYGIALLRENAALNMPVSTSVADSFYTQNYPASRLTDGQNTDSSNASIINFLSSGINWYEIDLLQSKALNQIKLVFQNAEWAYRPKDYVVDILSNGSWIRVVEQHNVNYNNSEYVFNFSILHGSKIRVIGSNIRNDSINFRLVELEAYNDSTITANDYTPLQQVDNQNYSIVIPSPQNVVLNMPVCTSTTDNYYTQNFPVSRLTDGQNTDSSNASIINFLSDNRLGWYVIDLQQSKMINQIKLVFQNAEWFYRPQDYAIDVLSGGVWVRVVEQHNVNYTASVYVFDFNAVQCNKIRIIGSNIRNDSINFRLVELEAYNDPFITVNDHTPLQQAINASYEIVTPMLKNLALNKPVSTSAADGFYMQNFPASRVTNGQNSDSVDGSIINYQSDTGLGWYEIDLQQPETINQIKLVFQNAEWFYRPQDYAIDMLSNGTWVRVVEQHNISYTKSEYIFNFASVEGSKIRIIGSNIRNASVNFRLGEVEAYNDPTIITNDYTPLQQDDNQNYAIVAPSPENIAKNKPVTTSAVDSYYTQNFPASRLTDGQDSQNVDGSIINYQSDTGLSWYEIDLQQPETINQIKLVFQNAEWFYRPKDYAIDVLSNGTWVRVVEQHNVNYADLVYTFNFATLQCSKIRITGSNARNSSINFRLVELEAYNNSTVTVASFTPLQQADYAGYEVALLRENIAFNKPVSISTTDNFYKQNFPSSRLTDGQNDAGYDGAIINYLSDTGLGCYEIDLQQSKIVNQIKLVFQNAEWSYRPKDYAIDVLSNGTWVRVVEQHNINYTDLVYTFNFASLQCSKIRIIGSNARNSSINFRLVELEAYNDPLVTTSNYTPLQQADQEAYTIPKTVNNAPQASIRIEAEDCMMLAGASKFDNYLASNCGYVGGFSSNGDGIEWNINVADTGIYNLSIAYMTGAPTAKHEVIVNDVSAGKVSYTANTGWSGTFNTTTINLSLTTGDNNIKIIKSGGDQDKWAEIDYVDLTFAKADALSVCFGNYHLTDKKVITNIQPGDTVNSFASRLTIGSGVNLIFRNAQGNQFASSDSIATTGTNAIATGTTVDLLRDDVIETTYELVIYGDVNGDGNSNISDLTLIRGYLLGTSQISESYKPAADFYEKGDITLNDLLRITTYVSIGVFSNVDMIYNGGTDDVSHTVGISYYVDAVGGSDGNDGRSPEKAFSSLGKINEIVLGAGDRVLFKKGCAWNGTLCPHGNGTEEYPIVIGMYGDTGVKPRINGNGVVSASIDVINVNYIEIRNMEVTNYSGSTADYRTAISVVGRDSVVTGITIRNCSVHDVDSTNARTWSMDPHWYGGIVVKGEISSSAGAQKVLIENNLVQNVNPTAIVVNAGTLKENVVIRNNHVSNIGGDGIMLIGTKGGLVEYNVVGWCGLNATGNPYVGIWAMSSDDAVIQYNESFGNQATGDGEGFDIDNNCHNCIVQYNYSHDNVGGFILFNCMFGSSNTTVRYNISQNDGKCIFAYFLDGTTNAFLSNVYNNTIYTTSSLLKVMVTTNYTPAMGNIGTYRNNIFYILNSNSSNFYDLVDGTLTFENNCFYGDEVTNEPNDANKITTNPLFEAVGTGNAGFHSIDGYKLMLNSSCLGTGAIIGNNGGKDYWGNSVATDTAQNVGAYNGSTVKIPLTVNVAE